MKRFFVLIISCVLLYACKPGIPKEIIQPDQMKKVLFDIHVVDGYISTISNKDTAKLIASSYYKGIYQKFDIDSAVYAKSMTYYYSHPDVMDKIYESVTQNFTAVKKVNDRRIEEEAKRKQNKLLAKDKRYLLIEEKPLVTSPNNFNTHNNPFSLYSLNL